MADTNSQTETKEAADKLVHTFYKGEPLSAFERDLEQMYNRLKFTKQ